MANVATLSDSTDTFSLYDRAQGGFADGGHDLGIPGASPRVLRLEMKLFSTTAMLTLTQLETNLNKIRRLLAKAARTTAAGSPRLVTFTVQPDTAPVATTYYVLGGGVEPVAPWNQQYLNVHIYEDIALTLLVEPWGYGPELSLSTGGALYGRPGIDARFIATGATGTGVIGTVAGVNTAALVNGSLAQNNKLTVTPTLTTMANQVAFYVGCTYAKFTELVLGIETAKTGSWAGVWEIMTAAATFAGITTASDLRSGAEATEFDTVRRVGGVRLTGSTAAWTQQAVGGVTAFWLRYRLTSFTSGLAPVFIGPIRSNAGLVSIAAATVPGDGSAAGLVHLVNPNAATLAGMKLAVATGETAASAFAPPFVVDLAGSNQYIPTGETTAAVVTDAGAVDGERVDLTVLATISDRAQSFDGVSEYVAIPVTNLDKLHTHANGALIVEVLFKANNVTQNPTCLASWWNGNTFSQCSWWLGFDQGQLRFMVANSDGELRSVNGSTDVIAGDWILATGSFDNVNAWIGILKDAHFESVRYAVFDIQSQLATSVEIRLGRSVNYDPIHSRSGQLDEEPFDGVIANVRILATRIKDEAETYSNDAGYSWPDPKIMNDSSTTRWLAKMENNAASLVITDSATIAGAAINGARSAANTNTRSQVGFFAAGVGQVVRAIGLDLPRPWGEDLRGRFRILLRVTPSATLATLDDVVFQLQINNSGDVMLPLGSPARFPAIPVPASGYYLVDLGIFTLPPVALRHSGPLGTLTSAKNVLQAYLWLQHRFLATTAIRLDCLYILPTQNWYGEFASFRRGAPYQPSYALATTDGVLFDALGPETIIAQSGAAAGYLSPVSRNPYADVGGADRFSLVSQRACWLFGIPLRGITAATGDYLVHVLADSLTPEVRAVGQYDVLALS